MVTVKLFGLASVTQLFPFKVAGMIPACVPN